MITHGRPKAQHLLYRGLRLEGETGPRLVVPALLWLEANGSDDRASFVLAPLLGRTDLTIDAARAAVDKALAWLNAHPSLPEAQFVLGRRHHVER